MKILIITGGSEREKEISLWSARNVKEALLKLGHKVSEFDYIKGDKELFKELKKHDLAFPVIHGKEGEGGGLQEKLELWNVKFVGPTSWTCKKGWDKFDFKVFCDENHIKTPKWYKIKSFSQINLNLPFILKPADEGSSFDLYVIKNYADLKKIDEKELFAKYEEVLVEEFIEGIEVTSGIWGEKILPLVEIQPPNGEIFDYENKYNGKTAEIPNAPSLAQNIQQKVKDVSEKIRLGLKIKDFSRIDYIVRGDEVFALETNTIPAFTSESLIPKAIKAAGLSFEQALQLLISNKGL